MAETQTLLGHEDSQRASMAQDQNSRITLLRNEIQRVDEPWHFVMVWPKEHGGNREWLQEKMPKPEEWWSRIFTGRNGTGQRPQFVKDGMSRKEFYNATYDEIILTFSGPECGFETDIMQSIDGDEVFLMIALTNLDTARRLAETESMLLPLKKQAYDDVSIPIPTDLRDESGQFQVQLLGTKLKDQSLDNTYPAHVKMSAAQKWDKVEDLDNPTLVRLVRRRMQLFVSLNALENSSAIVHIFPVHHWAPLEALYERRWNDLSLTRSLIDWPKEYMADYVVEYFGPEIGFVFHWFDNFTRALCIPAVLSIIASACRELTVDNMLPLSSTQIEEVYVGFACLLCMWSSAYFSNYRQAKNLKVLKWGMQGFSEAGAAVRKQFSDAYRGTASDRLQHFLHWFLCALMVAETVGLTWWLSVLRMKAGADPSGTTMRMQNETFLLVSQYIITVNIKVVDKGWTFLSTYLTEKENWRTLQDLKSAMVTKMFAVKFVAFYYPFLYAILFQPIVEGCPGHYDHEIDGCIASLRQDLKTFFVTQLVSELALLCLSLLMTKWAIEREIAGSSKKMKKYTYLEVQAKSAPYLTTDEVGDFMNGMLNYGFVVMFGVVSPLICFLCFISNFPMKRLLAYKLSYASQRPFPRGADGIGSWEPIMDFLGFAGVIVNLYIAVFVFRPMRDFSFTTKLLLYIAGEHVFFGAKFILQTLNGSKSTAQLRVEESQSDNLDSILSTTNKSGNSSSSLPICPRKPRGPLNP
eukprot:TRINITY_DN102214_c0_g1_i1.p1 TRINITY_DN102214_c0_g1~~TRINITY_DN102214_c0_g1_i1.p1  ORF type:complete len:750 (+),score=88.43 TRINITY_DN102214_c0_g1_i1:105-2354(+)